MDTFFLVFLGLLVLLVVIFSVGAAYVTRHEAQEREDYQNEARRRTDGMSADSREFYKSLGIGTGEQVKVRLYTLEEYRGDLGGADSFGEGEFIGALKTYRQLDEDWYETPPQRATESLGLKESDYRLDEDRGVLLLKRLPPGVPPSARDLFY